PWVHELHHCRHAQPPSRLTRHIDVLGASFLQSEPNEFTAPLDLGPVVETVLHYCEAGAIAIDETIACPLTGLKSISSTPCHVFPCTARSTAFSFSPAAAKTSKCFRTRWPLTLTSKTRSPAPAVGSTNLSVIV